MSDIYREILTDKLASLRDCDSIQAELESELESLKNAQNGCGIPPWMTQEQCIASVKKRIKILQGYIHQGYKTWVDVEIAETPIDY